MVAHQCREGSLNRRDVNDTRVLTQASPFDWGYLEDRAKANGLCHSLATVMAETAAVYGKIYPGGERHPIAITFFRRAARAVKPGWLWPSLPAQLRHIGLSDRQRYGGGVAVRHSAEHIMTVVEKDLWWSAQQPKTLRGLRRSLLALREIVIGRGLAMGSWRLSSPPVGHYLWVRELSPLVGDKPRAITGVDITQFCTTGDLAKAGFDVWHGLLRWQDPAEASTPEFLVLPVGCFYLADYSTRYEKKYDRDPRELQLLAGRLVTDLTGAAIVRLRDDEGQVGRASLV